MSKQFTALVLGLMLAAGCVPLAAQTYSFQSFNYPNATPTFALGINNRGVVVGHVEYPGKTSYVDFGFKRDANGVLERPFAAAPKPNSTVATGINDHGVIVGWTTGPTSRTGFLLYHGVFTYYNVQPGWSAQIYGINNQGDFVGKVITDIGFGVTLGFARLNGVVTKIQCPTKLSHTVPYGIAADGTIVGSCRHLPPPRATVGFIRGPAGQYQLLQVPGADSTQFNAINNVAHQIVGYYTTQGKTHGVVYDYLTGAVTTVDWPDPNTQHTYVTGINSQGVIVGYAMVQDAQGQDLPVFSFIGTPQ